MSIFDEINLIPLDTILSSVGIHTKNVMGTLYLYENGKPTHGWKGDMEEGIVSDYSGDRAFGDRITFIMRFFNINKGESVKWYKDNFHLSDEKKTYNPQDDIKSLISITQNNMENSIEVKKRVISKWESLGQLTAMQIEYLKSRGIDYNSVRSYVKNNQGYIACAIYDLSGLISIQNRSASHEEKRFMIEKGTNSKGVFISNINKEVKTVYVVEGMFDFLSLAQYGINVIGLKSAKDGTNIVKSFYHKGYEVIIIPDNDEAGKNVLNDLSDIKYSMFDLSSYEVKDMNQLLIESNFGENIINVINDERTKEKINIDSAFEKFSIVQKSFKNNDGRLGESSPFPLLDKETQGIIKGKVYTIGGYSNTGKSQFSYEYAQYFIRKGKKVAYFSVEVDTGLLLGYIAKAYYKQSFNDILSGKLKIDREIFKDLFLYDSIHSLEGIIKTVELEKPDIVFLDFIQGFDCAGGSEYEKMTKLATEVQQMAIRNDITIFTLSQVNNDSRNKDGGSVTLKGSGALFASSDVIMVLSEDAGALKLTLVKNKFGKKGKSFDLNIEFDTGKIFMFEDFLKVQKGI